MIQDELCIYELTQYLNKGGLTDRPLGPLQAIDLAAQSVHSSVGSMRYDLLVGADGASSMVRGAMQAQVRV